MNLDQNSRILITGGTGSFGKYFVKSTLKKFPSVKRLVIFSRDELKQWEMSQEFSPKKYPQIRYFLGDIRERDRVRRALEGIDTVIHAAALKQVPAAEYNPIEFIKTNVLGAENILQACLDTDVKKVISLSTDKAAAPVNLYGASKLCSDKLFIAANNIVGKRSLKFSIVRYGNVIGSRGSVIPLFLKQAKNGVLNITDPKMTRFNISLEDAYQMVIWSIGNSFGGEIFVPKLPSYSIKDVARAVGPNCQINTVGIRCGEKLHEEMITNSDSLSTIDLGKYYAILPPNKLLLKKYDDNNINYKLVENGFSYNSFNNKHYLNVEEIRQCIKLHVEPGFKPY